MSDTKIVYGVIQTIDGYFSSKEPDKTIFINGTPNEPMYTNIEDARRELRRIIRRYNKGLKQGRIWDLEDGITDNLHHYEKMKEIAPDIWVDRDGHCDMVCIKAFKLK